MNVTPTGEDIMIFASVVTAALLRAEQADRVPLRFTGPGPQLWAAFHNELTLTDLLHLAIQDAAVVMPQPFAPGRLWPQATGDELHAIPPEQVAKWIHQGQQLAEQSPCAYLRTQAETLGITLSLDENLEHLPTPEAHHRILELPGSAGWLAYYMASRPSTVVYYWENFTIACGTWQEQLLAGLIAFELGAPPQRELPIVHDPTLGAVLDEDVSFDLIVGLRKENERRADALRSFLRPEGQVVLL